MMKRSWIPYTAAFSLGCAVGYFSATLRHLPRKESLECRVEHPNSPVQSTPTREDTCAGSTFYRCVQALDEYLGQRIRRY